MLPLCSLQPEVRKQGLVGMGTRQPKNLCTLSNPSHPKAAAAAPQCSRLVGRRRRPYLVPLHAARISEAFLPTYASQIQSKILSPHQTHPRRRSPSLFRQTLRGPAHARAPCSKLASLRPGVLVGVRGGPMAPGRSREDKRDVLRVGQPPTLVHPMLARTAPSRESGIIESMCTPER